MAKRSHIVVAPRRNEALEKRLSGNPHTTGLRHIPLREPGKWQLYIANDYNQDDDLYRMVHEFGWLPLEADDLAVDPKEIGYRRSEDGRIVRGPQGREMVFKMAKRDYDLLQARKTEANMAQIGKPAKTKQAVAESLASAFGPEAGDTAAKHFHGHVTDTQEVIP